MAPTASPTGILVISSLSSCWGIFEASDLLASSFRRPDRHSQSALGRGCMCSMNEGRRTGELGSTWVLLNVTLLALSKDSCPARSIADCLGAGVRDEAVVRSNRTSCACLAICFMTEVRAGDGWAGKPSWHRIIGLNLAHGLEHVTGMSGDAQQAATNRSMVRRWGMLNWSTVQRYDMLRSSCLIRFRQPRDVSVACVQDVYAKLCFGCFRVILAGVGLDVAEWSQ
mmetsp:Transcript_23883/g.68700  ORF Transcript_23883/g.68700 Transcript_23883/m.68700 type:complete len:226 (+) Transcript_23883:634-1311(+)